MEDCLAALRQEVDRLDDQIAELFLKRMEVTGRIGACKEELGLPLMDPRRELEVLRSAAAETLDEGRKLELAHLFETVLALSRRDLRRRVGGNDPGPGYSRCQRAEAAARQPVERPRVVYQGVAGAYSEMASLRFFGEDCRCQGLPTFEEVFQTVAQGGADYGVVPIENSSTGAIRQVYELLGRYECYIVGENTVKVEHCLMAPHGATLDTITHVYSHEQGLFQCEPFLARHPGWVGVAHGDTAGSAHRGYHQGGHLFQPGGGAVWPGDSGPGSQLQQQQHHPLRGGLPGDGAAGGGGQDLRGPQPSGRGGQPP